jgi:predicted dehydrogenase
MNSPHQDPVSRRRFLKTASLAALAAGLLPRSLAAESPAAPARFKNLVTSGRKLRVACVGIDGKGYSDTMACLGEEIVALCDVDFVRGHRAFSELPLLPRYRDYRQMLTEMGDRIDAVTVSTPDHMHFPIALMAIEMGKHVYVQKPLTHTIEEARLLKAAAAKHGVVTQMGNQGHANEGTRLTKEWIDAGVIGTVREVHFWTNRPVWPQAVPLPAAQPVPATLDWNLWQGVAPVQHFSAEIVPFNWRGYWNYGCGALGDMGCHIMDAAFWTLDLRGNCTVSATSEGNSEVSGPKSSIVTYQFPQRGNRAPVKVVWYDGNNKPPVPKELGPDGKLPGGGSLFYGDKGVLIDTDDYNAAPRLLPEERMKAFTDRPKRTLPRVPKSNPHLEWIAACKGEGPAPGSNFVDHAVDLTEFCLLGNVAIRSGQPIEWDAEKMTCTNLPVADRFVRKAYRVY